MTAQRGRIRGCSARSGFTLVELLIAVTIIVILTAVTIPAILPAIESRKVSEAARVLQAQIMAVRDAATRADAPRGLRLLPDPAFLGPQAGEPFRPLAYNRIVPLEAPPDHRDGLITVPPGMGVDLSIVPNMEMPPFLAAALQSPSAKALIIIEQKYHTITIPGTGVLPIPNPPTNWYGNIRQGDKIYIPTLQRYFTIAGPVARTIGGQPNTERLIGIDENWTLYNAHYARTILQYPTIPLPADSWPPVVSAANADWPGYAMRWPEFLIVTNGIDDDNDGFIDEHFDGLDNNGDGLVDPAFDGLDQRGAGYPDSPLDRVIPFPVVAGVDSEWENDADLGLLTLADDPLIPGSTEGYEYRIIRRPAPAQGSSELTLPGDVLIDATTASSVYFPGNVTGNTSSGSNSRSRLPISPASPHYADFMMAPNGQVLQAAAASSQVQPLDLPFLHFWLAERADILPGYVSVVNTTQWLKLPVPKDALNLASDANYPGNSFLTKGRRLVSVNARTGQVVSNSIESFDVANPNLPFIAPQRGARETQ